MLRPDTLALTALLALLTAVGPMSVDFYLPSLPEIGRVFGASPQQVQLTLSGYLACFAVGQIVYGPISDHVGRKPVLLTALSPVVAPSLGGVLQVTFGWRAAFLGMAAVGLRAIVLVIRLLPETMNRRAAEPISLGSIVRGHGTFLRHPTYSVYLAIVAASYGGLFAWISGSSFVLQDLYGLSAVAFGLVFAAATLGFGAGTLTAAQLVGRIGIDRTIVCGAVALAAGGLAMVAAVVIDLRSPFALAVPMALYLYGLGIAMPQAMAGALMPFPERAGAASSLLGFLQQFVASAIGIVVGQTLGASALPLAAIIAVMGAIALMLALVRRSIRSEPQG